MVLCKKTTIKIAVIRCSRGIPDTMAISCPTINPWLWYSHLVYCIRCMLELGLVAVNQRYFLPSECPQKRNDTLRDLRICGFGPGECRVQRLVTHLPLRAELEIK